MKVLQILCAVDESSNSKHALKFAQAFAKSHHATLRVIHVSNHPDGDKLSKFLEYPGGIEILPGDVAQVIRDCSQEADLLILGRKGRDATQEFYGRVATAAIRQAGCPVVLIPDRRVDVTYEKLVFATDFKNLKNADQLEILRDLAAENDSILHLVHIAENDQVLDDDETDEAMELHDVFSDIDHAFFVVNDPDIVAGLRAHIKAHKPDLLAIMVRNRHTDTETLGTALIQSEVDIPIFAFHA